MNSDEQEKDAVTKKDKTNKKTIANEEHRSQLSPETMVRLEGTHTTATDTDALTIVNEPIQRPETSARIKAELETMNARRIEGRNYVNFEVERTFKEQTQHELIHRSVGDMIIEMNDNIQAIMSIISQRKFDEEAEQFKIEMLDYSKKRDFLPQQGEEVNVMPKILSESSYTSSSVPPSNHVIVDMQPKNVIIDSRQLPSTSASEYTDEPTTKITEYTCLNITDTLDGNGNVKIEPLNNSVVMPLSTTPLAPCESVYQTLHIHASTSPTSSVMYRPPICVRLWMVITDFFAAICICLQVNRDCIFCLGFFIAFVVSASFLTAFFYRTLSFDPQAYRNLKQQHQMEKDLTATYSRRPGYFD